MYLNEFAELGIKLNNRTSGEVKTKCPECHATRKNKSDDSLSVNIEKGILQLSQLRLWWVCYIQTKKRIYCTAKN